MTHVALADSGRSRPRRSFGFIDGRYLAPVIVTCFLLIGDFAYGILESYARTALAIVVAIGTEVALGRLVYRKWPHLASAYISGISVGMIVRSPLVWPFVVGSVLSIASKYVLRWRGRHLWNPSNFGLSALFFLAPASVTALSIQWGNDVWPMVEIWLLGGFVLWRLRRVHITLIYVATFLGLSFVRASVTGVPWLAAVAPITGPMYQLFIFFMITDPRTTVRRRWAQCAVAIVIGVVEMLLRFAGQVYAPLYALFIVGPPALAFELWWDGANPQRSNNA